MSMNGEDERSGSIKYGGHAKKVFECPQGPGRRYLPRVANSKKTQRNKKPNKPARKNANKVKRSATKSKALRYCILSVNGQSEQSRKGQKHTEPAESAGPQNTRNTSGKNSNILLCLKKCNEQKKERSKSRTSKHYICNA